MRIFVTGGTGFIGSHFLKQALAAGHSVTALRFAGETARIPLETQPDWVDGDLETYPSPAIMDADAMVHLAACGVNPNHANWEDCFRWNVTAPLRLWLDASRRGVRRFVIAGSCFEYGTSGENYDFIPVTAPLRPTGAYHSSKAAATMAALGMAVEQNREVLVLRPFHVYGEGEAPDRFWPSLREAALQGRDFEMTSGLQVRDFVRVEAVAARFLAGITRDGLEPGSPVVENVGSGCPKTLSQFAMDEWQRLGATGKLIHGAIALRPNEVMRYVPMLPTAAQTTSEWP